MKEMIVLAVVFGILGPTYYFFSDAEIPVSAQTCVATADNVFLPASQVIAPGDSSAC